MMHIEANDVFRILNFILVAGIVGYVIRRFGILQIMMMMRQQKEQGQNLKYQLKLLSDECVSIDKEMGNQEEFYSKMKDKFQIWHKYVQESDKREQAQFEAQNNEFESNQLQKLKNLQQRRLMQKELPILLQEITQDLQHEFLQSEKQQKVYMQKLFTLIEEKHT